jgi:uncharacterized membrane protein
MYLKYDDLFNSDIKLNLKTITMLALLCVLPNLLGLINIVTPFQFKIHFFQIAIFVAAIAYGPAGGLISGGIGSIYSAFIMHNPYIVIGNMILGFFVGLFIKNGFKPVIAALLAFGIQIPWLVATDIYLVHMPVMAVALLVVSLFCNNIIWAAISGFLGNGLKMGLVDSCRP